MMQTNPPAAFAALPPLKMLETPQGRQIAYRQRTGSGPTILYLHGYASDMMATKAQFLDQASAERGQAFVRFDYSANGESPGVFEKGTLSHWVEDALSVIDQVIEGDIVLVASSMGGWIGLHCARLRPDRIKAMLGIATAPDFTAEILSSLTEEEKHTLTTQGYYGREHSGLKIYRALLEDGHRHLLLGAQLDIKIPVILAQGKLDEDVPWQKAEKIKSILTQAQVDIVYIEDGDHRLSRPQDMILLDTLVQKLS